MTLTTIPRLELKNVSKSYDVKGGAVRAVLEPISLTIDEGEFLAVVGASGSGKTTLLNISGGLTDSDTGSIEVDGKPVYGSSPERGVIFQQYAVFPWLTVRQNIEFGLRLQRSKHTKKEARAIADRYVELMGLTKFTDTYPKALSGGMKQRVAIARAYAVDPEILLMDEPFGALDAQTRDKMQEVLLDVLSRERRSVMFVTHSVEEAVFLGNRVAILRGQPGRIADVVDVPFPQPRDHALRLTDEFVQLRKRVEDALVG